MLRFWKRKKKDDPRIADLDKRLTKNSNMILEDHSALVELTAQNRSLSNQIKALEIRIDQLERNQGQLREGLRSVLENDD